MSTYQPNPPCVEITLEHHDHDGEEFMFEHCYDFCRQNCHWPQDGGADIMACWAEYYKARQNLAGGGQL